MVHCGHKGMDMGSNITQVGTKGPKLWLENTPHRYSTNLDIDTKPDVAMLSCRSRLILTLPF